MPPTYRGNLGNLLQHWTWVEVVSTLQGCSMYRGKTLQLIDAHAMAPLAFRSDRAQDTDFQTVSARVEAEEPVVSRYESAWRNLSRESPSRYPSTAAFTTEVWNGPIHFVLCDRDAETAAAIQQWLDRPLLIERVAGREVHLGDWRHRFRRGLREVGDLTVFSFDPFMFDHHGPMKDSGHMWPDDLELVSNSISGFSNAVILQISTYTANNGNRQGRVFPVWQTGLARAELELLTQIAPNGNMMTAVFGRGLPTDCRNAITDNVSAIKFESWRAR